MSRIIVNTPPIGVKILPEAPAWAKEMAVFQGLSYCQAVHSAGAGSEVLVTPNSITTCRWSPVILGLKNENTEFDRSLAPKIDFNSAGIYLAPLPMFRKGLFPEVVILHAHPAQLRQLIELVGWEKAAMEVAEEKRVSKSSLRILAESSATWRTRLLQPVNVGLSAMRKVPGWTGITAAVFKSRTITKAYDHLIKRAMADMSICRNSTAIPYLTGKINTSFFCSGGIAWGQNDPRLMTSGWPWPLWLEIQDHIQW